MGKSLGHVIKQHFSNPCYTQRSQWVEIIELKLVTENPLLLTLNQPHHCFKTKFSLANIDTRRGGGMGIYDNYVDSNATE